MAKRRPSRFRRKTRISRIKAGADRSLIKVFNSIGVPEKTRFKPDPFQIDAVAAIKKTDCLVTAPTGAGKTWIAEKAISHILKKGGRSWYASPLKALTNAKYFEFSKIFGPENLGILTGDRKENQNAPVITGTTEILRNQLYDAMHRGESLSADLVILDEAHFLGDYDRGVVWEEIMIYLPPRIPLLLLSATIGNAKRIAKWLESIRSKECAVVEETQRPVPLFPLFFHPSGKLYPLLSQGERKKKLHKKVAAYVNSKHQPMLALPNRLPPFGEIITVLKKYRLLPAIFFLKSRADCDNALKFCMKDIEDLPDERKTILAQRIDELISQNPRAAQNRQMEYLRNKGVGAHHSGQLPLWKLMLETLMTEGLLDAVFATSTVAAGVNFPARSIVLFNSDRFNGIDFQPLNPTEFHQTTGRSGRRGKDNIGFAMAVPGRFMDLNHVAKLVSSHPSDVLSQIRINFPMVLNLLLSHTPDQIEDLLQKSFAAYLIKKNRRRKTKRPALNQPLKKDFIRHLNFLIEKGYVTENGKLTDEGIWASQLRVDHPLMIAECFRLRILPESDPALLAGITAAFVNEDETDDKLDKDALSSDLAESFYKIKKALTPFTKQMAQNKFEIRPMYLRPAITLYSWALGKTWEDVLSIAKIPEGNLAMLILRTSDNLRHIRALAQTFPESAKTASDAIELITRDPVVFDY